MALFIYGVVGKPIKYSRCLFFSRSEELETTLMEMVHQDNRWQLCAKLYSRLIQTTVIAFEYMTK